MCLAHIDTVHANMRSLVPGATKIPSRPAATFVLCLLKFCQETSFHFTDNQHLHSEDTDVLPSIFPLERWSERTVRADKGNGSQQLRTTRKTAEPVREIFEGDTAKHVSL